MNKLPNGWQIKTLGDIFLIERGSSPRPIKSFLTNDNNGINWIKIGDAKNNSKYIYQSAEKIRPEGKKYSRFVEIGDLILSNSMSFGRPYIMKTIGCIHDGWVVLRKILKNIIYEEYAYYILSSNQVHSEFSKLAAGSVVKNLSIDRIKQVYIPIPPLDEQKRIASALSKIDAYLENTIKLIEEKERFKRGIAKKLLTCKEGENIPEARFKGFEDEWKEYNLSKIGVSYNGLRNKKANSFVENCNAKYITYKSVYDKNKIDINRLGNVFIGKNENQNLVKYGDIFFTISSETPDEVAISSVLLDEVENTYLNSFCFGFRFDFNILLPEFARYYFRSDYIRKSTYRLAQGITRYNISKKKFLDIIIYLPSLEEQEKIGGYLSLLDKEIDNLKKQKELIKEMKRGAMQKLLSGEVRLLK